MTIRQAKKDFKEWNTAFIKANKTDTIKVNLEYRYYLDSLCKDGQITDKQYSNASNLINKRSK